MAANITALTMQCAAVVGKTHKTPAAMAANPAIQHKVGFLASNTPCQLGRNQISFTPKKRNKTSVAAYPTRIKITEPGIPFFTKGVIDNSSGRTIILDDEFVWSGDGTTNLFPTTIEHAKPGEFQHSAELRGKIVGSAAGLEYKLPDGKRWVIAWSNPINEPNKVYTAIVEGVVDWNAIKKELEKNGKAQTNVTSASGLTAGVIIDETSGTPTMTANLGLNIEIIEG